jgi:CheY-like chemotaxis protein
MMMPEVSGRQFREMQMSDPALSEIPIVIMSADLQMEKTTADLRPAGWLAKPIHLDVLLAEMDRHCKKAS